MDQKTIATTIKHYFDTIDNTFDKISYKKEGKIVNLPNYVFNKKNVFIFKIGDTPHYLIKAIASKNLITNKINFGIIKSSEELKKNTSPINFDYNFKNPNKNFGFKITNIDIREVGNINSIPIYDVCALSVCTEAKFNEYFSITKAKERAFNEWNNNINKLDNNYSFVNNLNKIFDKFEFILNKTSFLERRIHRFINEHALYILPEYINCYFEHKLYLDNNTRVADFILERNTGFPALLIELENSFTPVFKKNMEFSFQANHAGFQINEWVKYIECNSDNCKEHMQFLTGSKEKLVVMGRGLDLIEEMKNSKFNGFKIWTYDLLVKEAKDKWNKIIIDQCKTVGIINPNIL